MQTDTKPLWQLLNEQRTSGQWKEAATSMDVISVEHKKPIAEFNDEMAYEETKANAQYTALCVNNFANVVENLERLIDRIKENGWSELIPSAYDRAKEALSKIS